MSFVNNCADLSVNFKSIQIINYIKWLNKINIICGCCGYCPVCKLNKYLSILNNLINSSVIEFTEKYKLFYTLQHQQIKNQIHYQDVNINYSLIYIEYVVKFQKIIDLIIGPILICNKCHNCIFCKILKYLIKTRAYLYSLILINDIEQNNINTFMNREIITDLFECFKYIYKDSYEEEIIFFINNPRYYIKCLTVFFSMNHYLFSDN